MKHPSVLIVTLGLASLLVVAAPPARAQVSSDQLAAMDVVSDPAATLGPQDRGRLEAAAQELRDRGSPTKFVVLGQRPVNPPETARQLRAAIGFSGNVLVLSQAPRSLGIGSGLPGSSVQQAFTRSMPLLQADPVGGTIEVAERLAGISSGATGPSGGRRSVDPGGGGAPGGGLLLLGLLGLAGFALMRMMRRPARRQVELDLSDQEAAIEPLIDALAAQIGELDTDIQLAGDRAKEARPHYDEAVLAYGEVRDEMASSHSAAGFDLTRRTLERGLRAAQAARAILDGRPLPKPEEAPLLEGSCTFDPKHGRAVRKVRIATPAGDEATLPVCQACAEGLHRGEIPEVRRVSQRDEEVPYWQGVQSFGFGGGIMPMFGGLLGGMLLHDLLTPDVTVIDDGDFGGGDFGGGDFGGGDFGGGDFGGGDFGGGGDF